MNLLSDFFKGIIDCDDTAIVICSLEHEILYLNPAAAKRYSSAGGENLVGKSIFECHNSHSREIISQNIKKMQENKSLNKIFEVHSTRNGGNFDVYTAAIRNSDGELIGYYERFEDKNLYEK